MTILTFVLAVFIIAIIFWAVSTYFPSTPPPMNILKWAIYIILIIVLFMMLFSLIGWLDFNDVINHPLH